MSILGESNAGSYPVHNGLVQVDQDGDAPSEASGKEDSDPMEFHRFSSEASSISTIANTESMNDEYE